MVLWAVCDAGVDHPNQGPAGPWATGPPDLFRSSMSVLEKSEDRKWLPEVGVGIMCKSNGALTEFRFHPV